eukprot:GGOE01036802.1.p1 GENE.GGOE01036802.1~~GGOE01036802.1.p1  ORF type:complete len:414 (+),score=126.02 GGOE01036802.1:30-1271(+)
MGLVLSGLSACCGAVSLASCCLRMCSFDLGKGDEDEEGAAGGAVCTKAAYTGYLLVGYLLALCTKDGLHGLTDHLHFLASGACEMASLHDLCYGRSTVFRISFALVVFYAIHLLLSFDCGAAFGGAGLQYRIQTRMFGLKTLVFLSLLVVSLFPTAAFLSVYAKFALAGSGLFIIMQILVLLDFAYEWNDAWAKKEEPKYNVLLLVASLGFFSLGCVLVGFMYHWFASGEDCGTNAAFIHITLIAGLLYILVAIRLEHASILPATFVFLYSTFLCYSAIQSGSTSSECNLLWSGQPEKGLSGQVMLSSAVAIFTLMYSCLSSSASAGAFQLLPTEEDNEPSSGAAGHFSLFHLVMVLGSMYMAMILTDWSINAEGDANHSSASMWVKIAAQWVTIAAYVWTMFAPLVLPDRDF